MTPREKILAAIHEGTRIPAMRLVREDPAVAAAISKLVKSNTLNDPTGINKPEQIANSYNAAGMKNISDNLAKRSRNSENLLSIFPELKLSMDIVVTSILSPKDMVSNELVYRFGGDILPPSVTLKITDIIKDALVREYGFQQTTKDKVEQSLFSKGSYLSLILPEASVDEIINNGLVASMESLSGIVDREGNIKSLSILSNHKAFSDDDVKSNQGIKRNGLPRIATEHFNTPMYGDNRDILPKVRTESVNPLSTLIDVTDNYDLCKLPVVMQAIHSRKIKDVIRSRSRKRKYALESTQVSHTQDLQTSINNKNDSENLRHFQSLFYKSGHQKLKPYVRVKTKYETNRKSIGRPLLQHPPSECFIPVTVPGEKDNIIGGFLLIDEEGNYIDGRVKVDQQMMLNNGIAQASNSVTSYLIAKARNNLNENAVDSLRYEKALDIFGDIVERELASKVEKGIYGRKVEIARNQDIYSVMLARTYANQFTRLVYVPNELFTYYTVEQYENGIGKSLFDDLGTILGARAIMLFAKVVGLTKSSIDITSVNLQFDPNDPDPQKTAEVAMHEVIRMRQQYFPLGINTPTDLIDWISRAGIQFSFEGHPGIPQTKFDFESKRQDHVVPDSDLEEQLRKDCMLHIGVTPEMVDGAGDVEFAKTIAQNNLLFTNRIKQLQERFSPLLSDEARKIILNDNILFDDLLKVLKDNSSQIEGVLSDEQKRALQENPELAYEMILEDAIDNLIVEFPHPDNATNEVLLENLESYERALDKALDYHINTTFLNERTAGKLSNDIDLIKESFKAALMRRWMAENNYLSEVSDIISTDELGKPMMDIFELTSAHIKGLLLNSVTFIEKLRPAIAASDKDMDRIEQQDGEVDSSVDSSDSGSSSDSGDGGDSEGGDEWGGVDDFGMGTDGGGGEEGGDDMGF